MKETLSIKKIQLSIVAVAMAAIVALGMGVFAQPAMAENAVAKGDKITVTDKQGVKWTFKNKSTKDLGMTLIKVKAPAKVKTIVVPTKVSVYKGKELKGEYDSFGIDSNAFKGVKAKTIIVTKNVVKIKANAFKGSKATKLIIQKQAKGKKAFTKKTVKKNWLKGSKIKTVQVAKANAKAYKKLLTKKYTGLKKAPKVTKGNNTKANDVEKTTK